MKLLISLSLSFSLLQVPTARSQENPGDSSPLVVTKKSWARLRFRPGWDRQPPPRRSSNDPTSVPGPTQTMQDLLNERRRLSRVVEGYTYKATIKNTGAKTVAFVGWDYTFTNTETGEVTHHEFFTRIKIKPGQKKELERFVAQPPTRTVSASDAAQSVVEEVVIKYIEFADGTTWPGE